MAQTKQLFPTAPAATTLRQRALEVPMALMATDEEKSKVLPKQHIRWHEVKRPRPVTEWLRVALLTPHTLRTAFLAISAPLLCRYYGVTGHNFDPSLLSMLIATPAAFLIGAAFQRRERALQDLAEFRACAVNLHRAFGLYSKPETAAAGQRAVQGTFASFSRHLTSYEPEALQEAYVAYQDIGVAIERLRLDPPEQCKAHIETFVGRLLFDERTLFTRLETLRLVRTFRTPLVLRGFLISSCTIFPVLFAPYFAHEASEDHIGAVSAIGLSVFFSIANSVLVNIQEALEDPFDGDTADDISMALFEPSWSFWTSENMGQQSG